MNMKQMAIPALVLGMILLAPAAVEGQAGADTLQFNASNAQLVLSARLIDGHLTLQENFASILQERSVHLSLASK